MAINTHERFAQAYDDVVDAVFLETKHDDASFFRSVLFMDARDLADSNSQVFALRLSNRAIVQLYNTLTRREQREALKRIKDDTNDASRCSYACSNQANDWSHSPRAA